MVEIIRHWDIYILNNDAEFEPCLEILYKRPRIDYRVSEYIFEYINKNILEPNKTMQTGDYYIHLLFESYYIDEQKYFEDNPYNTKTEKYTSEIEKKMEKGKKYKYIGLFCYSTEMNENIKPKEYANMVYDMFGAFLIKQYKIITKEKMDKYKTGIDYEFIEKFKYPALFNEQKYLSDDNWEEDFWYSLYDLEEPRIKIKEEFIKNYSE